MGKRSFPSSMPCRNTIINYWISVSPPRMTMALGLLSIIIGIVLMGKLPQRLMPIAERNQFAVEISLPTGTAVEKTGANSRQPGTYPAQ